MMLIEKRKLIFCSADKQDLFSGKVSKHSIIITIIIKIILTRFLLTSSAPPNKYYFLLDFITLLSAI